QCADSPSEFHRPAGGVAMPERRAARMPRIGSNHHTIMRDLFDAPRACAQKNGLSDLSFVYHLLVQLTHAAAARLLSHKEHSKQPSVRNRSAAYHGNMLGSL